MGKSGDDKSWIVGLVFALIAFSVIVLGCGYLIRVSNAEQAELGVCQAAGYTWRATYANIVYCLRIDDGRSVGVPLEEVEAER